MIGSGQFDDACFDRNCDWKRWVMLEIFAHLPLILIALATICFAFQIKAEWSLLIASVGTLIMGVTVGEIWFGHVRKIPSEIFTSFLLNPNVWYSLALVFMLNQLSERLGEGSWLGVAMSWAALPVASMSILVWMSSRGSVDWPQALIGILALGVTAMGTSFISMWSTAPTKIAAVFLTQKYVRTLLFVVSFGAFQVVFKRSNGEHYILATIRLWESHPWAVIRVLSLSTVSLCLMLGWFSTALLTSTVIAPVAFVARGTTNLLHLDSTYLIAVLGSVALLATELGLRPLTRVSRPDE
jgi:hypothetical protein